MRTTTTYYSDDNRESPKLSHLETSWGWNIQGGSLTQLAVETDWEPQVLILFSMVPAWWLGSKRESFQCMNVKFKISEGLDVI